MKDMDFKDHAKDLLSPLAYDKPPAHVEFRQTHISYLYLTPHFVYKVKKSVNFGFLDFTTLAKRRHFCSEEVELNRRLAPHVYLGVVEIRKKKGRLAMEGGEGEVIEYAVKMRRLAEDTILEERIRQGAVTTRDITRVAEVIARFHKEAKSGPHISEFGAPEIIEKNIAENFSQIKVFVGKLLTRASFEAVMAGAEGFIYNHRDDLIKRVEKNFIRDCHGDIHSEHISINKEIEIIDCIEFNERFRYSDTLSDMAFLSMDLDFHGRADLARAFETAYLKAAGEAPCDELLNFYKAYRAVIRGKVEGLKAGEKEVNTDERAEARIKAMRYFDLARCYASEGGPRPRLIIICGVSGTGKSTLAAALGRALWATSLATDSVRQELREVKNREKPLPYGKGAYSLKERERTYRELTRRACSLYLQNGRTAILDGTFSKNTFLSEAIEAALEAGLTPEDIFVFECRLEMSVLSERVRRREAAGRAPDMPLSEMRADIFKNHVNEYEKKEGNITAVDTAAPLQENITDMIKAILWKGKNPIEESGLL
ncbi:MAG: AAA family ATPase [Thermodesulfobacteriota bacterium]